MNILSIITVTRNNHDLLDITFKSIRKEKIHGVEYIVIDGQSDDDSLTLIRNNNDIIDVYISEIDSGVYEGMNKGLSIASVGPVTSSCIRRSTLLFRRSTCDVLLLIITCMIMSLMSFQ